MSTKPQSLAMQAANLLAEYSKHDWEPILGMDDGDLARLTSEILECARVVKAVAERVVNLNDIRIEYRKAQVDTLRTVVGTLCNQQ